MKEKKKERKPIKSITVLTLNTKVSVFMLLSMIPALLMFEPYLSYITNTTLQTRFILLFCSFYIGFILVVVIFFIIENTINVYETELEIVKNTRLRKSVVKRYKYSEIENYNIYALSGKEDPPFVVKKDYPFIRFKLQNKNLFFFPHIEKPFTQKELNDIGSFSVQLNKYLPKKKDSIDLYWPLINKIPFLLLGIAILIIISIFIYIFFNIN